MIQRLAAVAVAIALVAGAFVVRTRVIEGDDGGDRGGSTSKTNELVCAAELPDGVCGEAAPVEETADALIAGDTSDITWLTPGPWPAMVEEARRASGTPKLFVDQRPLASTSLVAVVVRKPAECQEITWRCVGDAAIASGRVAAPSSSTSTRLLVRAALIGGYLDKTEYAINDLDEVEGARDWISAVERNIEVARRRQATSLQEFLATRGAAADVFLTTAADASRFPGLEVDTPQPAVTFNVMLGATGRFDAGGAGDALKSAGWDTDPAALTKTSGLPSPGVLLALREVGP